jgi:hypothetical protein
LTRRRLSITAGLGLAAVLALALIQKWPEAEPGAESYGRAFARAGPQVGDRLPDFTLPDTTGRMRALPDLVGPRGLVLVFNQSADW